MITGDALAICDEVSRVFGTGPGAVVAVHGTSCVIDAWFSGSRIGSVRLGQVNLAASACRTRAADGGLGDLAGFAARSRIGPSRSASCLSAEPGAGPDCRGKHRVAAGAGKAPLTPTPKPEGEGRASRRRRG